MDRHFEYIDANGKHWTGVQNIPSLPRESDKSVIAAGNRLLANQARAGGWLPFPGEVQDGKPIYVKTWHPDFPYSEHDDYVDTVSQALGWCRQNGVVLRKVEYEEAETARNQFRKQVSVPYAIKRGQ